MTESDINDRLRAVTSDEGTQEWLYTTSAGSIERYSSTGLLTSVTDRGGQIQRLTYSTGQSNDTSEARYPADSPACVRTQEGELLPASTLVCVTDPWGRQIHFEYDNRSRITKVTDPAGQEYLYEYDGPTSGCAPLPDGAPCVNDNLTKVTYPDGASRTYHYNESARIGSGYSCPYGAIGAKFGHLRNMLTGITDENGVRYANWSYDCRGRVTASEHASGIDKVTFSYGYMDAAGALENRVTEYGGTSAAPLNQERKYSLRFANGSARIEGINLPCPGCDSMAARTYDAKGNVISSKDFNGKVTTYTYDLSRNVELTRTEAAGTPFARRISTTWLPESRQPASMAEPLRVTTFDYDSAGRISKRTVQPTSDTTGALGFQAPAAGNPSIWSYEYDSRGLLSRVIAPRNAATMYTYDEMGNLSQVTNALGHATTLTHYDQNGRVGRITDPNGLVTELSYTQRGWISSSSTGGATTSYDYDAVGQLLKLTLPDGSYTTYSYDVAHRLVGMADSEGNSVSYTLDLKGNRIAEQVRDAQGNLARQISRNYDAVNRLKQITGALQ